MNDWNSNSNGSGSNGPGSHDPWAQPGQSDPWAETAPGAQGQHDPWAAPKQPYMAHHGYPNSELPRSTNGTLVLMLGLVSWFMCGIITALPGWLIARSDRQKIKAGQMQPDSTLEAGYWFNLVHLILSGLAIVFVFVVFFFAVFGQAAAG
jgi:hypothetical protein